MKLNKRTLLLASLVTASRLAGPLQAQDLQVSLETGGEEWVQSDARIELLLNRPLGVDEGRLAVLVGTEDRTDLFRRTDQGLAYRGGELPLPAGDNEVVVFLVRGEDWQELARLPLQVLSPHGFTRRELSPRIDVEAYSEVDNNHEFLTGEGDDGAGNLQIALGSTLGREAWELVADLNIVGVTREEEALRFGLEGDGAPPVDLASYNLRLTTEKGEFELGHMMYGESRHLVNGFSSRGVRGTYQVGSRADASFAAMNGSDVVGWDNPFGLRSSSHRMLAAGFGVEALPRPGALRLGLTVLDGSVEPVDNFNQGSVNDAEESDGWSVRVAAASPGGRVTAEGSYTRSNFTNPTDPLLDQGADVVAVNEEERDARSVQVGFDIVRDRMVKNHTVGLRLGLSHDRVDPPLSQRRGLGAERSGGKPRHPRSKLWTDDGAAPARPL